MEDTSRARNAVELKLVNEINDAANREEKLPENSEAREEAVITMYAAGQALEAITYYENSTTNAEYAAVIAASGDTESKVDQLLDIAKEELAEGKYLVKNAADGSFSLGKDDQLPSDVVIPKDESNPNEPGASCGSSSKTCNGSSVTVGCWGATGAGMKQDKGAYIKGASDEGGTPARECMYCNDDGSWDLNKTSACHDLNPSSVILPPNAGTEYTLGIKMPSCEAGVYVVGDLKAASCLKDFNAKDNPGLTIVCSRTECHNATYLDACPNANGGLVPTGTPRGEQKCYDGGWISTDDYNEKIGQINPPPVNPPKEGGNGDNNKETPAEKAERTRKEYYDKCDGIGDKQTCTKAECDKGIAGTDYQCKLIQGTSNKYGIVGKDFTGSISYNSGPTAGKPTTVTPTTYKSQDDCKKLGYVCKLNGDGKYVFDKLDTTFITYTFGSTTPALPAIIPPITTENVVECKYEECEDVCTNRLSSYVNGKRYCGSSAQVREALNLPSTTVVYEEGKNRTPGAVCQVDSDCANNACDGFIFGSRTCRNSSQ